MWKSCISSTETKISSKYHLTCRVVFAPPDGFATLWISEVFTSNIQVDIIFSLDTSPLLAWFVFWLSIKSKYLLQYNCNKLPAGSWRNMFVMEIQGITTGSWNPRAAFWGLGRNDTGIFGYEAQNPRHWDSGSGKKFKAIDYFDW